MKEIKEIEEITLQRLSQEEREIFRDTAQKTFNVLRDETKNRIKEFESKILSSENKKSKVVDIVSALIHKDIFYLYEDRFSKIVDESKEIQEENAATGKLTELLEEHIFLELPEDELVKNENKKVSGVVVVNGEEYNITFKLERVYWKYHDSVKSLYDVFCLNNAKWRTCNIPYMSKAFKLILEDSPYELQELIKNGLKDETVIIDKGDLENVWVQDHYLIWNIKETSVIGKGDINPTENRIHGEYKFNFEDIECMYVCPGGDKHIYYTYQIENDIYIAADEYKGIKWDFYKISPIELRTFIKEKKQAFSNKIEENLLNSLKEQSISRIRNLGELKRMIHSFKDIKESFELERIEIADSPEYGKEDTKVNDIIKGNIDNSQREEKTQNRDLNSFIEDEFSLKGRKNYLRLYFKLRKSSIFTKELLDFIVSEIQLYFPEYQCIGEVR